MKKSIIIIMGIICLYSCIDDTKINLVEDNLVECGEDCDSLFYEYERGELIGVYVMKEGRYIGGFAEIEKNDTIYGYNQFVDEVYKRTFRMSDSTTTVMMYVISANKFVLKEALYFYNDQIDSLASSFVNVTNVNNELFIENYHDVSFDSLFIKVNGVVIEKLDSIQTSGGIKRNISIKEGDKLNLVFNKYDRQNEYLRFILPISYERINNTEFLHPHLF